jgi:mono/diheme cytochrome c family protein
MGGPLAMMINGSLLTIGATVVAVSSAWYWLYVSSAPYESAAAGHRIYSENCAKCHGARLEGQPDWMRRNADGRLPAPPHDDSGHTWHHSDKQLFTITKFGLQAISPGYESDMPAFETVLSDEQIVQVFDYIKSTWPERARKYQAARSKADP